MSSKQQLILFVLLGLVAFRFFKSGQFSSLSASLNGGGGTGGGKLPSFMTKPNSKSNPTAGKNGSLPGGTYPGLVQPGSPGSATNPIYGA